MAIWCEILTEELPVYVQEKSRAASNPVLVPLPNRRTSLDAVYAGEIRASMEHEHHVSESEPIAEEEYTAEVASYPVWCVALYDYKVRSVGFLNEC